MVTYAVSVKTGDKTYAGTDANVFINLTGDQGDSGDRPLHHSISPNINKFERNQVHNTINITTTMEVWLRLTAVNGGCRVNYL